ncbi:MAG: TetR/AcrR family transcriptional regulator [Bacteroidales bacterium]|nr:TetR/AcrR family transcriptional regulator [Bacteroidales bacterium]
MKTENTEAAILAAANKLFAQRGFNATSTTDIAREAGCNQALVHYYFRTKENLFQKVFISQLEGIIQRLQTPLVKGDDIFTTLRHIVDTYFDILEKNPQTPSFLLSEMLLNPGRESLILQAVRESLLLQDFFHRFSEAVGQAIARGQIRPIAPKELYFDIISLVVFSYLAMPMAQSIMQIDQPDLYLRQRRQQVYDLLAFSLKS